MTKGTVVVIGATPKSDRFAHRAQKMLNDYGYKAVPVNPAFPEVLGATCYKTVSEVPGQIDTVTLYLGEARSTPIIDEILKVKPRRIIMNPGAENAAMEAMAKAEGIEVLHDCTLVMLQSGKF